MTLPLGLSAGRTWDIGDGQGIDASLGVYGYPVSPNGGPDWALKFGITWIL